jgi:hypothetical protein
MRRDPEYFGEAELALLYMARRLPDALRLEKLLDANEVDYLIETGTYTGGMLIRRDLTGAFFYVGPSTIENARELLLSNGYKPYDGR